MAVTGLEEIKLSASLFLDKTSIFLGGSDTGKSTVMRDVLYELNEHIKQIFVICPTDPANQTYESGLVAKPLILYDLTDAWLWAFWQRQEELMEVYKTANDLGILESLFFMVAGPQERESLAIRKRNVEIAKNSKSAGAEELDDLFDNYRRKFYKAVIEQYTDQFAHKQLTDVQKLAVKYLHINPRIVLVFDDATDILAKFKDHDVFKKIFYQGRHYLITILIAAHDDKAFDTGIKKNAFNYVFTDIKSSRSLLNKASFGASTADKKRADAAITSAFTEKAPYQKMLYTRLKDAYYRFTATKRAATFQFGGNSINEYCRTIEKPRSTDLSNSKFL